MKYLRDTHTQQLQDSIHRFLPVLSSEIFLDLMDGLIDCRLAVIIKYHTVVELKAK